MYFLMSRDVVGEWAKGACSECVVSFQQVAERLLRNEVPPSPMKVWERGVLKHVISFLRCLTCKRHDFDTRVGDIDTSRYPLLNPTATKELSRLKILLLQLSQSPPLLLFLPLPLPSLPLHLPPQPLLLFLLLHLFLHPLLKYIYHLPRFLPLFFLGRSYPRRTRDPVLST